MKDTKDNFSRQSEGYARFRPGYPDALFEWLYTHCRHYGSAWDCATGNGQAAVKLAEKFEVVYATDLSIKQLENATVKDNIRYSVERAETPSFAADSFDLVTVAQSLHWFDHKLFFEAVKKVAKEGALFAAWGYDLPRVDMMIDDIIDDLYRDVLGGYWDEERKYVDNRYATLPFPFAELSCPEFTTELDWEAEHMIGYLNSWSAVQHYIERNGSNPVDEVAALLKEVWGAGVQRKVRFPVFMRAGIIKK